MTQRSQALLHWKIFWLVARVRRQIRSGLPVRTTGTYLIAAFAEDDWRIKPRLTLNLGLREEIDTAPTSNTDNLGNFAPTTTSGIAAVTQPFKNQYTFEPRVGMAWDITGKGTTTLRAGGGVLHALITLMNFVGGGSTTASNYDNAPTGEALFNLSGTSIVAPGDGKSAFTSVIPQSSGKNIVLPDPIVWANSPTSLFPSTIPAACGNGLAQVAPGNPAVLNPPQCLMSGGDPNLKYYQYYFWNVNFQHAFTNTLSLDIGYVGSRTTGIIQSVNLNQAAPTNNTLQNNPSSEETRAPFYGPYPWFSNIFYQTGGQNDNYRSLQIYLIERPTHGLSFTGSYTYAGNFESQGVLNVNVPVAGVNGPYSDNAYPAHNIAITTTYDIPGIKTPGQMLEGWTLTGHISYISGVPQTFSDTTDDLTGAGTGTPWTLSGPAGPFNQIFGRAGTIPCYGVAANAGAGIAAGTFAKAPCTSVLASSAATPWSNMPAACIQAAQNEPSFTSGLIQGQAGTGLAQLAAIGCYVANGSVIVPPAQGTYGSMLPDSVRGPGFSGLDASLSKTWKIKERYSAQFRAEGFNLFNRTIYTGASTNLGSPKSFGLATFTPDNAHGDPIQSRGGARYVQLGLKLFF